MSSRNSNNLKEWILKAIENFEQWDSNFYLWKSFNCGQRNLLRAYVGLVLFGLPDQHNGTDLRDIWFRYGDEERKIITELADKFKFEYNQVTIGHTYLYLDSGFTVCVFRQMKSNNQIIFIDNIGRIYTSWDHFRETNRLPSCKYIGPNDGLHKMKQELLIYLTPAASPSSQILSKADLVAAGCSLTGAALIGLSVAPFSALILGTIGTVYGVGRSIGILADRSNHEESIGFDNAESVISWMTIGTSVITGASTAALSKSAQIVELAGNSGNIARAALKGLNYAALTSNFCNLGTYVYFLQQKIVRGEELTALDLMEGCMGLFLIVGAVSNTRQMNKYINSLESKPTTAPGRLTRTVKRRLQRLRAKLRKSGTGTVATNADIKEVTILEENIPSWGISFICNGAQQMLAKHTNIHHIYYKCLDIWHTCFDFRCNKIGLVVFVSHMINHVQNLFILVTDALVSIKAKVEPFLRHYFSRELPNSLTEQIGHMVENTTSAVKKVDERLLEDEDEQPAENEPENEPKLKYEIIIDLAKNRIPRTTPSNEIISAFCEQLSSLIEEIPTEVKNNYEECVSKNIEKLGRIKADEMFSNLGMKTLNDFANLTFVQTMKNKNNITSNHTVANEQVIQKLLTSYKELLAKATPQSTLAKQGVLETCNLLEKSLIEFFNPLSERFKCAKELYEINVPFVGHQTAISMVLDALNAKSIKSTYTNVDLLFFAIAVESLYLDKISRELSTTISSEKTTVKISPQLSDDNIQFTVLSLCDKFFLKVAPKMNITTNAQREKIVKHSYQYFMESFTDFVQELEKGQKTEISTFFAMQNTQFFNPRSFVSNYRKICEMKKCEMFASAVEHFTREENLAALAEKYTKMNKVVNNFFVEVCNEIKREDGVRMYSINEGSYLNLRAYKLKAAELFDLIENNLELVKWEKGAVILRYGFHKNIVFQTVDTKSMIAMEIDTSKKPASE